MTEPIDPFGAQAAAAPEEAQQQTPPTDPWSPPAPVSTPAPVIVGGAEDKVTLTFKGGRDFDAPWVVVHASNLDEALSYVTEGGPKLLDLFTRVQKAADAFKGTSPAGTGSQAAQAERPAPAVATALPANAPAQPAPGWVHKQGVKNGRAWAGWFPPMAEKDLHKPAFYDPS